MGSPLVIQAMLSQLNRTNACVTVQAMLSQLKRGGSKAASAPLPAGPTQVQSGPQATQLQQQLTDAQRSVSIICISPT